MKNRKKGRGSIFEDPIGGHIEMLQEKQFLCSEIYEESWGQFFWSYSTNVGQPINIPGREGSRFAGQ